jgi:hypothetical protein
MILVGFVLSALYFGFNFRFEVPVFAVISSYMETRFLATFRTNFADETIILLLLCGFSLVVFSKERNEHDGLKGMRSEALRKAIITDIGLLLFSVLFIYGTVFIAIVMLNLILPFVLYLFFFYMLLLRARLNK